MHRNFLIGLILIATSPMLACSLYRAEGQAVVAASDETTIETSTPTPTDLPIIDDVEQVAQEIPQPTSTATALQPTRNLNDTIRLPGADQNNQATDGDTDQNNNKDAEDRAESAANPPIATPVPSATATPTATPSPTTLPVTLVGGWPPILPDASNLNQGDGYATYQTGFDAATVADFYRREMAAQGWAEFDFDALAAAAGQGFVASLQPRLDQGATILAFSQDGGDTLSFVFIYEETRQVEIVWVTE